MTREDLPAPREGFVLTHYLTASDVDRSRDFYADVLGGQVVLERSRLILAPPLPNLAGPGKSCAGRAEA